MDSGDGQDKSIRETSSDLSSLCRIGGIAAFILIVYSLATIVQMVALGGPPTTAAEAFTLLQHNKALGLLRLDLPTVIVMHSLELAHIVCGIFVPVTGVVLMAAAGPLYPV